jgi:uncharacterized protein (DUF58 family)
MFSTGVSADRLSRKFGIGMEFADYRAYTPGDDFRYIDWSAYARRDELLIKLFTEDLSTPLYFVIDASRSMSLGTPEKLFYSKKIAAALGYIGLSNLDPVTMITFDDKLRLSSRVFQGKGQLRAMLAFLEQITPGGGTALGTTFRQFVNAFSRGMVILLSDFLDRDGYEATLRLIHYHHFDLIAVQVNDRDEIDPSFTGDLELIDSETGQRTTVQVTPNVIARYKERRQAHYVGLAGLCKALQRGYMPVVTDTPFEDVIFDVFRRSGFLR